MPMLDWQLLAVIAIVMAAAGHLGWRGWRTLRSRATGCGTACGGCPAPGGAREKPLVEIERFDG